MATNSKREIVEQNLGNIKEWMSQGATMESIAKALHMSKQTLYKYLKDDLDAIKNSREPAVKELECTMFNSAKGYTRKVKKYAKLKRCIYDEGKKWKEWEEMVEYEEEVYYPPSDTAGIFLLKNWGNYMNEPRAMDIRQKELELREKQVDANLW